MAYTKTIWTDGVTALSKSNLDHLETQYDEAMVYVNKNLINILHLKLKQALSSSDIDAWVDIFLDSSRINASTSSNYAVQSGLLTPGETELITFANNGYAFNFRYSFGHSNDFTKEAQTFTLNASTALSSITVYLSKNSAPTDLVFMDIYSTSGGLPDTLLYTSTAPKPGASLTTSAAAYTFNFSNVFLTPDMYAFVLRRSGSFDTTNYYNIHGNSASSYSGGAAYSDYNNWTVQPYDLGFIINERATATVVFNAVTATEALLYMAVSASQTLNNGTITWYVSKDGTNWVQITLDTMTAVNFNTASAYLKCVLTKDAAIDAVAYGGH